MSKVAITMTATYASPELILHEGKTYKVDADLAKALVLAGSGKTPTETAAVVAKPGTKVTRPDPQPDPGDVPDPVEVDEDDDEVTA